MPSRRVPARSAPPPPPGDARRLTAYVAHTVLRRTFRDAHLLVVRQGRLDLGAVSAGRGQALLVAPGTEADLHHDLDGDARHEAVVLRFDVALLRGLAAAPDTPAVQPLAVDAALSATVQAAVAFLHARSVAPVQQRQRLLAVLQLLAQQGYRVPMPAGPATSAATSAAATPQEPWLDTALTLLQTTRLPLATVVQQCGGVAPARFAAAFMARFGFAPSLLRAGTRPAA